MAKKKAAGGVNKSELIRAYKAEFPDAKPKAIVEGLAAKGVEVNAQIVSTVLSNAKKKGGKVGKGGPKKPDKAAKIAAEDAAHRSSSKRIAVDRQVVHEGVMRQANRDVMGGTASASNSVRQTAGTAVTSSSHSGMTSDFDAGGGYRTTEKVGKILNEMGVKAPDGGRVKMT
ncbi:MAG: hypothetical protein K2X81_06010, partial [Candidatus Obscuribacterales bacterium]|nr:hypothetical protein [Candidatus Obscuribacterales bacterium]